MDMARGRKCTIAIVFFPPQRSDRPMDLGISGRKVIVCASSRGLGRACAFALAQAGCDVVVNGRNDKTVAATAEELRLSTGANVTAVVADVATAQGQAALLGACPEPDIKEKKKKKEGGGGGWWWCGCGG